MDKTRAQGSALPPTIRLFAPAAEAAAGAPVLDRFGRTLATLVIVSLVAIWLIFTGIAVKSYRNEWRQASLVANNIAALLEREIGRTVEVYELSLKAVIKGLADPRVSALPKDLQRSVLFDQSALASGLGTILVIDNTGHILLDSRGTAAASINMSDRDYFTELRDGARKDDLFVSKPVRSRTGNGEWSIALGRRLSNPDGSFAGVVVGAVRLSYILSLYTRLRLPPESSLTLFDLAGATVLREPFDVRDIGRQAASSTDFLKTGIAAGEFMQVSNFDAVRRLFVYRRVGELPLVQSVGLSANRFLADWLTGVAALAAAFLVLSALILVLGGMLWRELQRRSQAERALSALATTDGLTGLTNRRRFNEVLAVEWMRCARAQDVLCLLMIDCDYFKAFNDSLGHLEGDAALRSIATVIRGAALRPADIAARFGGEEFIVMLPATDVVGAQVVAETIRARVMALNIAHPASPAGIVTLSVGVAGWRPSAEGEASALVRAADTALYQAKASGRNAVKTAAEHVAERAPLSPLPSVV